LDLKRRAPHFLARAAQTYSRTKGRVLPMHAVANVFAGLGLAVGIVASVLASDVQVASAAPQINAPLQLAPSAQQSAAGAIRRAPAKKQTRPKAAIAHPGATPAAEGPVFMSEEYLRKEKLTEDRLKRAMTICKGC